MGSTNQAGRIWHLPKRGIWDLRVEMTNDALTAGDLHMMIEVLDGLEQSYTLDIQDGINRTEDSDLIPWARRVRTILAQALESSNSLEWSN